MRIDVTVERLDAEVSRAKARVVLEEYAKELRVMATEQITGQIWQWPGPTLRFQSLLMGGQPQRRGGVLMDRNPRDIVDTGQLAGSSRIGAVSGDSVTLTWTAPYAANVIKGVYGRYRNPQGAVVKPGYGRPPSVLARNFIAEAQAKLPFQQYVAFKWPQVG